MIYRFYFKELGSYFENNEKYLEIHWKPLEKSLKNLNPALLSKHSPKSNSVQMSLNRVVMNIRMRIVRIESA